MPFDIGKRFRELRLSKGYPTVDSFAAAVGLSRSRISNLENNIGGKPHRTSLAFLLSKLGVSEEEFFHGRPAKNTVRDSEEQPAYGNERKRERRKAYGRREYDLVWQGTTPTQRERLKRALAVLKSEDKVTRVALEQNIEAFHRTVLLLGEMKK